MTQITSRKITSNQTEPHDALIDLVKKHQQNPDQRPISDNQRHAFESAWNWQQTLNLPFLLDTGCGTGQSSLLLAQKNPDKLVIGVDQSKSRLNKNSHILAKTPNLLLVQARMEEFWLQALEREWHPEFQYFFYPNPWPKKKHIQRRWHGHPIFPVLVQVCSKLELRTNWPIYAEEFQIALSVLNIASQLETILITQAVSPFEEKYNQSNHSLFRLTTNQ